MDHLEEITLLLLDYGLTESDVKQLIRGLEFDLDQMAVRDALGGKLSTAQRQEVKHRLLRGDGLMEIVAALAAEVSS